MHFLNARWEDLILANYEVDPQVLEPYVPGGTLLDLFEGQCFVSLVAFMFKKTRVMGIPVPFHRNFEEVNLRFYIHPEGEPEKRSVAFIKEIVPRSVIPLISNTLFKEHYVATRMSHKIAPPNIEYTWGANLMSRIAINLTNKPARPASGSIEEFITEHYLGFTKHPGGTIQYEVFHPQWEVATVTDSQIDVDFAMNYGEDFAFLNDATPVNLCYTKGSDVSVSFPSRL
ncbi:MAG: DUF2071 domain-containing protein [Akkermansiaceae bacterium]|nr:DUF2071 domain-containing protein [Akkermansiaceae bacterium]